MAEKTISIAIKALNQTGEALSGVQEKLGGINLGAIALGGMAAAGVGLLAKGLWDAGQAAAAEEVGIAKLGAAVRASGADWDTASGAIEASIAALRRKTALDDGDAREALSRLTTTTGDYKEALDLLPLALDLATAKDMDLKSAAELVGKVAEGNTGVLKRYGITLDEGATATDALRAMQEKFGGQAEAFGQTYEGQQKRLQGALGDLKETIGGLVLPIMTKFAEAGADLAQQAIPVLESAIEGARPVFEAVFSFISSTVVPILSGIVGWVVTNWPEISRVIGEVLGAAETVIRTVLGVIEGLWSTSGDTIIGILKIAWDMIYGTVENAIGLVRGIIETTTALIHGDWKGAWEGIKGIGETLWEQIKLSFETAVGLIRGVLQIAWDNMGTDAQEKFLAVKNAIVRPFQELPEMVRDLVQRVGDAARNVHIPLPHLDVGWENVGTGVGLSVWIPKPSINWYGSGLDAMFNSPTLIGVGEAGPERVRVTPAGKPGGGEGDTIINFTANYRERQEPESIVSDLRMLLAAVRS